MADLTFAHYYQTEVAYLRALAREFADKYPEVAHMVAGADGSGERMLQGAALIFARLRLRIEDDIPDVAHALFDEIWPQFLRPFPASTLLQFKPRGHALQQSYTVDANTVVLAQPPGGARGSGIECPFQTSWSIEIHPVEITTAEISRAHPADLQLRLKMRMTGGASFDNVRLDRLQMHFVGEENQRFALYLWMAHAAKKISIRDGKGDVKLTLGPDAISPVGLSDDAALAPFSPTPLPGLRLLREYFVAPEKFLGVMVSGLAKTPANTIQDDFELVFHLGRPSNTSTEVSAENFALGCTPVINISGIEQVEIQIKEGTHRYLLSAPDDGVVFAVDRVGGYDKKSRNWVDYQPFFAERHARLTDTRPRYQVLRRADGVEGAQTYLLITDHKGIPVEPPADSLSVWLSYTNGDLATRIGKGQVNIPTASSPEFLVFQNILPVNRPDPIGLGRDRHWQLAARFNMHPDDLASINGLQQLLREARSGRSSKEPRILQVESDLGSQLYRRAVVPLRRVTIEVDEGSFDQPGQFFLFATLLSRLFVRGEDSATFNEVTVKGRPSGETYNFGPQ